jgi:methylmalonyl-CoA/ethylmalonyl-CoA epimerase
MKVLKLDHLGIAVKEVASAARFFRDILGLELAGTESVEEQNVTTMSLRLGESQLELLESTSPDGPVARFIEGRGEGIQHLAIQVENIEEAMEELKAKGIPLIDQEPRRGASGARIAFLHPRSTFGILIELTERR